VVERDLLPHCQAEPVREHQQRRVARHVVGAQQIRMHRLRVVHLLELVVH